MPDTNDGIPVEDDTNGAAAAMDWLEANKPSDDEPVAEPPVEDQPDEVKASEEAKADTHTEEETIPVKEVSVDEEEAEDSVLKFFPDDIRTDYEAATTDEEKAAVLRGAMLKDKDYRQKTQALAEDRRKLESEADGLRQKAEWWDQLSTDPAALAAATGSDEEPFDYLSAEPEQIEARIDERANAVLEARDAKIAQNEEAILEYKAGLEKSLQLWQETNDVDAEVSDAVTKRVGARLDRLGIDPINHLTVDNLPLELDDELRTLRLEASIAATKEAAEKSKSDDTRAARASSPPAQRAAGIEDPKPWLAEDRDPKKGEIIQHTLKEFKDAGVDFDSLT